MPQAPQQPQKGERSGKSSSRNVLRMPLTRMMSANLPNYNPVPIVVCSQIDHLSAKCALQRVPGPRLISSPAAPKGQGQSCSHAQRFPSPSCRGRGGLAHLDPCGMTRLAEKGYLPLAQSKGRLIQEAPPPEPQTRAPACRRAPCSSGRGIRRQLCNSIRNRCGREEMRCRLASSDRILLPFATQCKAF